MATTPIISGSSRTPRRDRRYWQSRFNDWRSSGLSKAAFCRRDAINVTTFYYWCGVFSQSPSSSEVECADDKPAINGAFVPVALHREPAAAMTVQLADVTLSCQQLISSEQLGSWLTAIRRSL